MVLLPDRNCCTCPGERLRELLVPGRGQCVLCLSVVPLTCSALKLAAMNLSASGYESPWDTAQHVHSATASGSVRSCAPGA